MKYALIIGLLVISGCKNPRVGGLISPNSAGIGYYGSTLQPLFDQYCIECHAGPEAPNGLQLTSYEKLMQGAIDGSGKVVVPGSADSSIIIRRLKGLGVTRMPKGKPPLPDSLINRTAEWIEAGAAIE
jgi:hypothetical protein